MIYKTQVAIIGAGPAGLLLSRMLFNAGIESSILENRNENYLRQRLRAGVQEEGTVKAFIEAGVGEKLQKESMQHHGIRFHFAGEQHYLNVKKLTGGKVVTVYGQRNISCDMIDYAHKDNIQIIFEAKAQRLEGLNTKNPVVHFRWMELYTNCIAILLLVVTVTMESADHRFQRRYAKSMFINLNTPGMVF